MCCLTGKSQNKIADLRILSGKISFTPGVGFAGFFLFFLSNLTSFAVRQGRALGFFGFNLHNKLLFRLLECLCWWMEPQRHRTFCSPLGTIDALSLGRHVDISAAVVSYYTDSFRDHSHISFCAIIWLSLCYFVAIKRQRGGNARHRVFMSGAKGLKSIPAKW